MLQGRQCLLLIAINSPENGHAFGSRTNHLCP
jgi:hypothetical protein